MIRTGLSLRLSLLAISFGWVSARAQDGERALLIVDPDNAESMYVAHYYQAAYDIPANHILYMDPGGDAGYADLVQLQLRAFLGTLSARGLEDSIDFVILPPGDHYKVSAPGLVSDGCVAVQQFSLPSAYSLARQSADILGGLPSSSRNHFANTAWDAAAFSGATAYRNGNPSTASNAERYFLGTMLGWTGQNGNTVSEILELIDRSVAVRGTQPVGTVYFMETTDVARSGPRQGLFPQAVVAMGNAGGVGQHLFDVLPLGHHDAMGVMTGAATPDILNLDYSLLPGSFADHLTSYAADLTNNSQAKMTLWLTKGASGTSGAIEEPCNYAGKFPTAALHTSYRQGATLGEAWFRHLAYAPFQTLFLGDSLTRPYDQAPTVSVPGAPTGPVTGTLVLTPQASASVPGASIAGVELWVDGVRRESVGVGASLALDSTAYDDGWHELRVRAVDSSAARFAGHWVQWVEFQNHAASVSLGTSTASGSLETAFVLDFAASGGAVQEVRLWRNGRIVASAQAAAGSMLVYGQNLGAAAGYVQAEAVFQDGRCAWSAPLALQIAATGVGTSASPPVVYDYERTVGVEQPFVLELPASFDSDPSQISYAVLSAPAQASLLGGTGSWRALQALATSTGSDTLTYQAHGPGGTSTVGTITLHYDNPCPDPFTYCNANPNSTGSPASIGYFGSTSVQANDLVLTAWQVPPGAFGLFFYGQDATSFPSGDGNVCFASHFQRLPVLQSDLFGLTSYLLDMSQPPQPAGTIAAGATWNFQFWYRDTGFGQAGYNFSDALAITFCD